MSYDLRVWSVREPAMPAALPEADRWVANGDGWSAGSGSWQVTASAASRVLAEDLPAAIETALPGIAHLVEIAVEPIGAPEAARRLALRAAKELAKSAHGLVEDRQTDEITLPSGVKRFVAPAKQAKIDVVALSWWCEGDRLGSPEGIEAFLGALERTLPEAMPKRYGSFEPPKHVYEEEGRAHLAQFLRDETSLAAWYPHRPVRSLTYAPARSPKPDPRGFKAGYVRILIEAGALEQPGWRSAIARAWRAISTAVRPFYGDARILRGYVSGRATLGHDRETEEHPVVAGWWSGIPARGAFAAVVGQPYLAKWPRLAEKIDRGSNLAFLELDAWSPGSDVFASVGGVPSAIGQRAVATGFKLP